MGKTVRGILAVIAGFVAAGVVMMLVESFNGRVLYPELGRAAEGLADREAIRALLASAPMGALLVVILGWTLGSLVGGFLATWIARSDAAVRALVLGGLLTLAGVANNFMLPPPTWFWIPTLLVFLPAAYAGARLVTRR